MSTYSAVFPGCFNPITQGHVDLVARFLSYFDHLWIAVVDDEGCKRPRFSSQQRVQWVKEALKPWKDQIDVQSFNGLLVGFMADKQVNLILRGLRSYSDFDYERSMAQANRELSDNPIETFWLPTLPQYAHISSSLVRQVWLAGGDITAWVPDIVNKTIYQAEWLV